MAGKEATKLLFEAAADAERLKAIGHGVFSTSPNLCLQALQRPDHGAASGQMRTGSIRSVFTITGEGHHNHGSQDAQHHFGDKRRDVKTDAVSMLVFKDSAIDGVTDDPCKEHDKSVNHSLNQGQGNHIAIGNVAHFMRSEEHTSELQSRENLVCRLLLEK